MRKSYHKVPLTIRLTPIQKAVLDSARYRGCASLILRWFIDKLIEDKLPAELKAELELLIEQQSQNQAA